MPRPAIRVDHAPCQWCNRPMERKRFGSGTLEDRGAFTRRLYCNRDCMARAMEGMKVETEHNGRRQAAKTVKPSCECCGRSTTRLSVHHIDENPTNNDPSNLKTLCGSCHHRTHSPNYDATGEQRVPCLICGEPSYRKAMCCRHYQRLRRHGDPLMGGPNRRSRRGTICKRGKS